VTKHVQHPGPPSPIRLESHLGAAKSLTFALEPGLSLRDAIARPLQRAGLTAAGVTLRNVGFHPLRYVIPAFAPNADHAAYYSDTFSPPEPIEIDLANLTYGRRADGPFLHCHALWRDPAGALRGGHLLPFEAIVATPGQAEAFGTADVEMLSDHDPETNFSLFRPIPLNPPQPGEQCLLARIRPNEDLTESIELLCRRHGIAHATIRTGVGSTIGLTFDDGRVIRERPTEHLILAGHVAPRQGNPTAHLTLAVIDVHGRVHQGAPARGENPVLICFELVIQPKIEAPL
jgi:predicted DNA-binding protein with PD1-like motif